jgi:hypothetical protein
LKVAARVAVRSDTLLTMEQAFNAKNVYPPHMRQIPGTQTYKGDIEKGYELEITDVDVDPTMSPKMNGISYKNLDEVIDDFSMYKSIGGKLQFTPSSGTVDGIQYKLNKYEYDDTKQEEQLVIEMHFSNPKLTEIHMDVTTNLNGAVFKSLSLVSPKVANFGPLANDQNWGEIAATLGMDVFDPITEIYEPASRAVEHAAFIKMKIFMDKNNIKQGGFFDWVRVNGHSIVDGGLVLKKT